MSASRQTIQSSLKAPADSAREARITTAGAFFVPCRVGRLTQQDVKQGWEGLPRPRPIAGRKVNPSKTEQSRSELPDVVYERQTQELRQTAGTVLSDDTAAQLAKMKLMVSQGKLFSTLHFKITFFYS